MALQCNIDSRGKFVRLVWGLGNLTAGILLAIFWAWPGRSAVGWVIAGALGAGGLFAIFESWAGWCVVRAMGFKTRM